jgi:hypothetical protein
MSKPVKKKQPALFDVVEKIEQSTASVTELRVPIFSPVQKLSGNSVTAREFKKNGGIRAIETSWGQVEIRGRKLLTQVHRDLLDCIYTHSGEIKRRKNGEVTILFSQTKILKEYSGEAKSDSWAKQTKWLREKIKEIRDVTINYVNNNGDSFDFNLISHLDYLEEINTYAITLDPRYLKFYERELSISYQRELSKLLKVESALVKAIIRWFFTHKDESKYRLLTVLEALGFPVDSPKTLQVAKRELREEVEEFRMFGIDYDPKEEIFFYRGNPNVGFVPSLLKIKEEGGLANERKLPAHKITSFLGRTLVLPESNDKVTLKSVDFENDGALIENAVIITEEGVNFSIRNVNELEKGNFENEVSNYLQKLLE